jgi:hypothetical protein
MQQQIGIGRIEDGCNQVRKQTAIAAASSAVSPKMKILFFMDNQITLQCQGCECKI